MNDDENTAGESVSIDRSALHKSLRILVLVTASLAALIGVCATGVFDWHIQKMLADYSVKRPSIIEGNDNSPSNFSEDYFRARKRFIEAGRSAGAVMSQLILTEPGPAGEPLSIDIAWLGSLSPEKVLLHTSGLHGVEGFAGSAIQLKILENPPKPPANCAIILIHILNPYGMAWLRRYNESNVDLNRNFRFKQEEWLEDSRAYAELDNFLNPKVVRFFDSFIMQALYQKLRDKEQTLRKTIPRGQNVNPKGIFFCGTQLEEGSTLYTKWVKDSIGMAEYILVIDVHTGLGYQGQESLFHKVAATDSDLLSRQFERNITTDYATDGVRAYAFKGAHSTVFEELTDRSRVDFLTQEFGTYPNLYVLQTLRDENRGHHYGDKSEAYQAKQRLKEAFSPGNQIWQSTVIRDGAALFTRSAEWFGAEATQEQ
jgi:hypothetical protein